MAQDDPVQADVARADVARADVARVGVARVGVVEHDRGESSIAFISTLDDCAELFRFVYRSPSRIALQALIFAGIAAYLGLLTILVGLVTAIFTAPDGFVAAMLHYLERDAIDDLRPVAPWIGALCGGLFVLNLLVLVPRQCRLLAKRSLGGYPEIRRDDPTMALTHHIRVGDRGIEGATRDERIFVTWPMIVRLVERRDWIYLMLSRSGAIILPRSALADEAGQRVVETIRRALATSRDDRT